MPVYEYACRACGAVTEHLQPLGSEAPGPCEACGGELRRRFTRTDKLLPEDRRGQDFRALRERAERIADGED